MKILLIEDDRKAARIITKGLQEAGFGVDVRHTAEDGDVAATTDSYSVIVLDVMLPGKDGLTLCRDLRARGVLTPVLMLTARSGLDDLVSGFNAGADDYLVKPFVFEELLARLQALHRRSTFARPVVLSVADLRLDPVSLEVTRSGVPIHLTPMEYAILEILMRHTGEVVTRTSLGEQLWKGDECNSNLVDVHVSHLRRKIDRKPWPPLIQTIWGRGYRLGRVADEGLS